ncbi:MAG: LPS export ABC transporter permease LptG [Alphaproteobacteria bacterium]
MNSGPTFWRYLARQYLFWLTVVFLVMTFLVTTFDIVELLRRGSGKDDVTLLLTLQMAGLKLPLLLQDLMPFVVLFGTMFAYWRMSKANELVVARAAGMSAWQFLMPALVIAALLGMFQTMVLNPFAAASNARFEQLESEHLERNSSQLSIAKTGFWLRQADETSSEVIHAETVSDEGTVIYDVMVLQLARDGSFFARIDARSGELQSGYWMLRDATITDRDGDAVHHDAVRLETELTLKSIKESFASAKVLSFWELPGFIETLDNAGFSAIEHRLHFQTLLSNPLLLCAMVLVAAIFSLRATQRVATGHMVLGGVFCGFAFFFATQLVHALGLSATVPVALAAWMPGGVTLMLGITAILHMEDG